MLIYIYYHILYGAKTERNMQIFNSKAQSYIFCEASRQDEAATSW